MQIWAQLLQQVDHPVKKTQKSIGARSGYANFDLQITNTKVALTKHDEWTTKFMFLLAILSKMGRGIFTFERRRLTFKQFEQSRQRWPELRWFQKTESSENKVNILAKWVKISKKREKYRLVELNRKKVKVETQWFSGENNRMQHEMGVGEKRRL